MGTMLSRQVGLGGDRVGGQNQHGLGATCGRSQLLGPWLSQRGGCTLGKVLVGVGTEKVFLLGGELFSHLYPRTKR